MSKKLNVNPCPFCGSTKCEPRLMLGSSRFYHILCTNCGTTGPLVEEWDSKKKGVELSVNLWNKRK